MYVCMYYMKNDEGKTLSHWEVFEELEAMINIIERIVDKTVGPILTFETTSAFIYNK